MLVRRGGLVMRHESPHRIDNLGIIDILFSIASETFEYALND